MSEELKSGFEEEYKEITEKKNPDQERNINPNEMVMIAAVEEIDVNGRAARFLITLLKEDCPVVQALFVQMSLLEKKLDQILSLLAVKL